MEQIFVTGAAGFIGANLVSRLLETRAEIEIVGIDNLNDYYDVELKKYRLSQIDKKAECSTGKWTFVYGDITDAELVLSLIHI